MSRVHAATAALCALLFACDGDADGSFFADTTSAADATSATDTEQTGGAPVCARWNAVRAELREPTWSGDTRQCDAGDVDDRAATLALVNLYRELAGLPPVALDATKDAAAQACALLMDANDALEHDVPAGWTCYDEVGAAAAKRSNIATTSSVDAIDLYMIDPGVATLGHRRWILSNTLGPVGVGSTDSFSCLHVIGGSGAAGARWTAWPPPGDFPLEAAHTQWWTSLDETGWSIQSDTLDLSRATVTVTDDAGNPLPVRVDRPLAANFGSRYALAFRPDGWESTAGSTYHIAVRDVAEPIDYAVRMVTCSP